MFSVWKQLNGSQRAAFTASFLGWTLDAFDYFILVWVVKAIAHDFQAQVSDVTYALFLTLAMRPVGAFIFGWLADHFGRRPILMLDVLLFSGMEVASAFAPNLKTLLVMRALFGIAMGGEWGIGASLVMESIPPGTRGVVSGWLQEGYAVGYLLAAGAYGLLFNHIGWRGMLVLGVVPAVLALYIRLGVKESPGWERMRAERLKKGVGSSVGPMLKALSRNAGMLVIVVLLMAAFNFYSHGTQDLFPTFLETQRHLSQSDTSLLGIVASVGMIVGGVTFGAWSQRIGRRRAIICAVLLSLPLIPLWVGTTSLVAMAFGAFLMQFSVQGAWGVIPAHLNELSPDEVRGMFPGFAYQLGNLLAAKTSVLQSKFAEAHGNNYAWALAGVAGMGALVICLITSLGPEKREAKLA